jgi:8-oxo-dGTP pyrophosphatase MutT (NUDIX family)
MSIENQEFLPGLEPDSFTPQSVALLLIKTKNNRPYFLVAKRLSRRGSTIPGGKLEEEETLKDAIIRETVEETGVHLFSTEYLISAHPRRKGILICDNKSNFLTHLYFAFFDEATNEQEPVNIESEKHGDWQWIPLSELPKMIMEGDFHPVLMQDFVFSQIKECLTLYPSS